MRTLLAVVVIIFQAASIAGRLIYNLLGRNSQVLRKD
jgi:hypothetical protein